VLNKNDGSTEVNGYMAFDCTDTTCPLDSGKHVWRIDLGKDYAVSGLTIQRRLHGNLTEIMVYLPTNV